MHELSIAQNIVDHALAEAARTNSGRVEEIEVEVGELTQVETRALSYSLKLLLKGEALEGCRVKVRHAKTSFECRKCMHRWGMAQAKEELKAVPDRLRVREPESKELPLHFLPQLYSSFIHCPRCGSSDISALGVDDVRVRRLVLR